ncbi:MAG: acyltransferase [Roseburia faecis]|jgi:surface polysaccharide O-acyltransferase-like enzyme
MKLKEIQLPSKQASKQASISYLRIFATMCVVVLHTCSTLGENSKVFSLNHRQLIFFNTSYQIMYWCVPVFLMITGGVLLKKEKCIYTIEWITKYARRTVLALIIFGIPYAGLKIIMQDGSSRSLLDKTVFAVLTDTGFGHLWYLYVLTSIYLIMPILKNFTDKATEEEIKFFLAMLFLLDFCIPQISKVLGINIAIKSQLLYPIFYVLLGQWLLQHKNSFDVKVLVSIACLCIVFIGTVNIVTCNSQSWTQYDSPLIAIFSGTIFLLFVKREWKHTVWLWSVDRLCFGVYLIHPLVIQFSYRFLKITPVNFKLFPIITVVFALVFITLSFVASWIMRQIKFLQKYVL